MQEKRESQLGRSLLEAIAVIVLSTIVVMGIYKVFRIAVDKAATRKLEQDMGIRISELRHQALTSNGIFLNGTQRMNASGFLVKTIKVDKDAGTFTLRVGDTDKPLDYEMCQNLMNVSTFSPNNTDACHAGQNYADFDFPMYGSLNKFPQGEYNPVVLNEDPNKCRAHARKVGGVCKCNAGYYGNGTNCKPCSEGTYSSTVGATSSASCIACPAGTYLPGIGSSSSSACRPCGDRRYSDETGSSSCSVCDPGTTHNSTHTGCSNCPASTTLGSCGCSRNEAPDGNGGCVELVILACDAHAHQSLHGGCKCNAGYYGNGEVCVACAQGTYSTTIGATSDSTCIACPVGTYSVGAAATSSAACIPCGDRRYSNAEGSSACSICAPGTTHNSTHTGCENCSASTTIGDCGCKGGYPDGDGDCIIVSTSSCGPNATEDDDGVCICDAGYYGDGETCTQCSDGQYSAAGAETCSTCPAGQTHNSDHTGCRNCANAACLCNAGYYGDGETCTQCGDRQYSAEGAETCSTCPAGQTHNSGHTGCENCTDTTTLGVCGCTNGYANGTGGCLYWTTWDQPTLSSNGTMGSSDFACSESTVHDGNYCWKAFDKDNDNSYWHSRAWGGWSNWISWYTKDPIRINSFAVKNRTAGTASDAVAIKNFKLQYSNNGSSWSDAGSYVNQTGSETSTTFNVSDTIYESSLLGYRYWKIDISSGYSTGGSHEAIREITINASVLQ